MLQDYSYNSIQSQDLGQPNVQYQQFVSPYRQQQQQQSYQQYQQQSIQQSSQQQIRNVQHHVQQVHHHIPHIHKYKVPVQKQIKVQEIQPVHTVYLFISQDANNTEMRELYHIEREVQVISVEDVEEPWKRKCVQLEVQIYDLQTELARYKKLQFSERGGNDDVRIRELEGKIRSMQSIEQELRNEIEDYGKEIEEWRDRYRKLQKAYDEKESGAEEIRALRETISNNDRSIIKLEDQLRKKDIQIDEMLREFSNKQEENEELRSTIYELEQRLSESSQSEERITYLTNECDTWKKKFREVNQEFHKTQEDLMLCQAELDSIKNKKTIIKEERTTMRSSGTQIRTSNQPSNLPNISVTQPTLTVPQSKQP